MRLLLATITILMLTVAPALGLEPGATFNDDGTCVEADGTPGLSMADGECVTAADYDLMFSYEVLEATPTQYIFDGDRTVAEQYNVEPDVDASDRLIGVGLVENPFTFKEALRWRPM